jgi:hypothetical protein
LWNGPIGFKTNQSLMDVTQLINTCAKLIVLKNISLILFDIKDEILTNLTEISWKDRPNHTSIDRLINNCTKLTNIGLYITETSVQEQDILNLIFKNAQLTSLDIQFKKFLNTSAHFPSFSSFKFMELCPHLTHLNLRFSCYMTISQISEVLLDRKFEFFSITLQNGATQDTSLTYNHTTELKTIFVTTACQKQADLIDFFDVHRDFTKVELKFQYWEYITGAIFEAVCDNNVGILTEFMYNGEVMSLY